MYSRKCKICIKTINGLGYYGGNYVDGMVCYKCNETHIKPFRMMENEINILKLKKAENKTKCLID